MQSLIAALIAAALVFIQCYISGTRLAYSLPAYAVIGIAAILSLFSPSAMWRQISRFAVFSTVVCFSYLITRALQSPVEYLARTDLYCMLGCLAVYGVTATCVTNSHLRGGIITVLLGLAVTQAMMGVFQYAGNPDWLPFNLGHAPSPSRGRGTFISSIHFAGFLELMAPFGLAAAFWGSRTPWLRIMAGATAVLCYFAIGLSGSRGAWISSAFSLLIFAGLSLNASRKVQRERFPAMIYLTVLTVIILPATLYYLMQQSAGVRERLSLLEKISDRKINEYDVRIYNWEAALDQWRISPMLGTGAGTHLYYGRQFRRPPIQSDPIHAHSDYLELLAEYGYIGCIAAGLFLLAHLRAGAKGHNRLLEIRRDDPYRSSPELAFNIGALTALSAYIAHSAVDFNLHLPGNALLTAFIFGLLANHGAPEPRKEDEVKSARKLPIPFRLITFGLGGTLIGLFALRMPSEYWASRARVALGELRLSDAIENAERAIQTESKDPFVYYDLGQAYRLRALARGAFAESDLQKAEQAYRAGIAIFPQDEALWVRLGQTLDARSEFSGARQAYQRALELDPNLGILYGFYARHLARVGRPEEAKAAFERGQPLSQAGNTPYFKNPLADEERNSTRPK